jgi:hypothetical protein
LEGRKEGGDEREKEKKKKKKKKKGETYALV